MIQLFFVEVEHKSQLGGDSDGERGGVLEEVMICFIFRQVIKSALKYSLHELERSQIEFP